MEFVASLRKSMALSRLAAKARLVEGYAGFRTFPVAEQSDQGGPPRTRVSAPPHYNFFLISGAFLASGANSMYLV